MKISNATFIAEQEEKVMQILHKIKELKGLGKDVLRKKPDRDSWSVLECLEHLNRYSQFYLAEFKRQASKAANRKNADFTPGWLGSKSADYMLPKNGSVANKMKTFKSKNPALDQSVNPSALEQFHKDQKELLALMEELKKSNLNTYAKTTLPILKFKLGDALAFYINHELRHMVQIERTLSAVSETAV